MVLGWSRKKVKRLSSTKPVAADSLKLLIIGGAGTGKRHLIKTIFYCVLKTFKHGHDNPEIPSVSLLAPTGEAAINIEGTIINSPLKLE